VGAADAAFTAGIEDACGDAFNAGGSAMDPRILSCTVDGLPPINPAWARG
jgi:hypothetical protein